MGSCLSKKDSTTPTSSSCASATRIGVSAPPPDPDKCDAKIEKKAVEGGEESVKKEIFVIKHRKSHSHDTFPQEKGDGVTCTSELAPQIRSKTTTTNTTCSNNAVKDGGAGSNNLDIAAASLSSSSCTKEEVDAILIQCGRLSRSSSGKAASSARKYSGSKRSYDFDHRDNDDDDDSKKGNGNGDEIPRRRSSRASSLERRRTPSRERSGSRDRGSSGSGNGTGRRVSRSPARRSQTPSNAATSATVKMVSVPATVSSLVMDKSNNGGGGGGAELGTNASVKRISVKRNVGAASPRSQSPAKPNFANAKVSNENHQQQPSLSRSSSRKAERSPYRRNPLSDIDTNSLPIQQLPQQPSHKTANNFVSQSPMQKPNVEDMNNSNSKVVVQGANTKNSSRGTQENKVVAVSCRAKEQHQQQIAEAPIKPKGMGSHVELTTVSSGAENLKPQTVTRSRSSRRSRDLDLNPETLLNPAASYTTLLLEDIQNFHQKTNNTPSFSLPPCVTKACSILEAVADLNSCTPLQDHSNKYNNLSLSGQKGLEAREPFMESELEVGDDIMEPSLHKYVTVRRGTVGGEEMEEQESSGSNSFVSGQQHGGSSSCSYSSWEPNSASSIHCWTSRSNSREEDLSPLGFQSQRHASGCDVEEAPRRLSAKKRDSHRQRSEITHGSRGVNTLPTPTLAAAAAAAAAST